MYRHVLRSVGVVVTLFVYFAILPRIESVSPLGGAMAHTDRNANTSVQLPTNNLPAFA